MEHIINKTVEALRHGATVLYPTDTIWGLGCDARRHDAVERLYTIKGRDRSKSMLVLCSSDMVAEIPVAMQADSRPTTYILPEEMWRPLLGNLVARNLPAADGGLGIRVPRHDFCQQVIAHLGAPLVSTSANLSGQPSPTCYADISDDVRRRVDFCVPPRPEFTNGEGQGSRIVKLYADGSQTVLRP